MESNGEAGKLMISESTKEVLEKEHKNHFYLKFAKNVEVSNFGSVIPAYFCSENEE